MNVLAKDVPKLDYNDPVGSLEKIYNYLFEIMEQIDYTLSRQGIQLGKVSLPTTAKEIEQIAGQVNGLASNVAVLTGTVSVVNDKTGQAIQTADTADEKAEKALTKAQQALDDLAALINRVTELEQKGEN